MSKRKLPNFIFTTKLLITVIKLDITSEVVLLAKYYDVEAGCYRPSQMLVDPEFFTDLVDLISKKSHTLFALITDTIPKLTTEPFIIDLLSAGTTLILDGGIFGLNRMEFFDEERNKFVDVLSAPFENNDVVIDEVGKTVAVPSKLDPTKPTLAVFDFIPSNLSFNPHQQWAREIGDNHRFLALANQLAYLQIRYRFYLRLRSMAYKIGPAKGITNLRPPGLFTLARTIYSLSANPNNFTPD